MKIENTINSIIWYIIYNKMLIRFSFSMLVAFYKVFIYPEANTENQFGDRHCYHSEQSVSLGPEGSLKIFVLYGTMISLKLV